MTDKPRLIEHAFPLEQVSLDSVREKYGPRGHISGFHLWPARRPLAACRAALIATLLPDPGDPEKRLQLCAKIGGQVTTKLQRKKMPGGQTVEREVKDTESGVTRWLGRPKTRADQDAIRGQKEDIEWFRQEIRKAYGGRAPKVLDPFAGGGAIPLEAMRLGCEATAVDINPVAWFILKCTLEYPQKLGGQTRPLPDFILTNRPFMEKFLDAQGMSKREAKALIKRIEQQAGKRADLDAPDETLFDELIHELPEAGLAWHVRAWGQWVLDRARRDLAKNYPTYADFEPLKKDVKAYEKQPMRLVPLRDDGVADIAALNGEFTPEYLKIKSNPRWVAKPTAAYLWARTVTCKNCRATVPLLKTRWLCKKTNKRVLLTMELNADGSGVDFGIDTNVPAKGGNAAQKREHDKRIGAGTMSRSGAQCPCCPAIMTMEDIRTEGKAGRLRSIPTAVVVDGQKSKEYRLPMPEEIEAAKITEEDIQRAFAEVPLGIPEEPTPAGGGRGAGRAFSVQGYGLMRWRDLFTARQLMALGSLAHAIRSLPIDNDSGDWRVATLMYLAATLDRLVDQSTTLATWYVQGENVKHTFVRYALGITWDYAECNPMFDGGGSWASALAQCAAAFERTADGVAGTPSAAVYCQSSKTMSNGETIDLVFTDPPYYDAIPYSDLMDIFLVWLRRVLKGVLGSESVLDSHELGPKWNSEISDGELVDDDSRHNGDTRLSKQAYEEGMAQVFRNCWDQLRPDGRAVVVFANKQPEAWETLVSALIRSGFIVNGSWPIQTENATRSRARASAALASSIWLICKKRPETARPGWDNAVLDEMRANIGGRMREYWDAGIRGPDFVWAATGPALEAYSKHPVVKKANEPGPMTVGEFLNHVRRIVVDFVVGRVLSGDGDEGADAIADRLDEPTAYYMLHRNDFGFDEAPAGTVILYAVSCGLSDRELVDTWGILASAGKKSAAGDDDVDIDPDSDAEVETDSGSKFKLKTWAQRHGKSMGYEAPGGKPIPLIDRIHRLMHLWKAGDVHKVDEYLDEHGLRRQELFARVIQSLIELSDTGSSERSLLESLSNHIGAKGAVKDRGPVLPYEHAAAGCEGGA